MVFSIFSVLFCPCSLHNDISFSFESLLQSEETSKHHLPVRAIILSGRVFALLLLISMQDWKSEILTQVLCALKQSEGVDIWACTLGKTQLKLLNSMFEED